MTDKEFRELQFYIIRAIRRGHPKGQVHNIKNGWLTEIHNDNKIASR